MAYYLNFDGVDDRVNTPLNITFDAIEIDFSSLPETWHTYLSVGTNKNVNRNGNNNGVMLGSDITAAYVNGSPVVHNTDFLPTDTRVIFKVVYSAPFTNSSQAVAFMTNTATQWVQGKVWGIKFYNAAALVVHYDFTTGNGQDKTGNGKHAVITGATFIEEGGGDHPVTASASATFSASATVVKNRFVSATASFVTSAAATLVKKRFISASASAVFSAAATVIKSGGDKATSGTATFTTSATATVVRRAFKSASAAFVTSATATVVKGVHVSGSAAMRFTATLFQGSAIIADETLKAQRALYGTLRAERSMYIELRGDIMTAVNQNIEMYAGESKQITYPAFDEQGEPLPLTGGVVELSVERREVEVLIKALPILGSSFTLSLVPIDTASLPKGIYQYTATFTDGIGNVSVLAEGDLTIKR